MKTCNRCLETKTLEGFYARPRMKDGYSNQCRRCEIDQNRQRRQQPEVRERLNALARARGPRPAEQTRAQRMWTWHRMTPERFAALLEAQGGKCAIPACGATEPGGHGTWHIDHDHACCDSPRSCGECVRGLLCSRCNPMLGMARDNVAILLSAADYLTTNAAMAALDAIGDA